MTLRQKLCEPFGGLLKETATELEKIADDYAIEFFHWYENEMDKNRIKELLEIYKKEKGL